MRLFSRRSICSIMPSAPLRRLEQQGTHFVVEQTGDLDALDHAKAVALQRTEILRLASFQAAGLEGIPGQAQGIGGLLQNQPEHRRLFSQLSVEAHQHHSSTATWPSRAAQYAAT